MKLRRILYPIVPVLSAVALVVGATAAYATVISPPPGGSALYAAATPTGSGNGNWAGLSATGQGRAVTVQVTTLCSSGGIGRYWTGWVQLNVPASGTVARNSNPCDPSTTTTASYWRELYPFGRLCGDSAGITGGQWLWNTQIPNDPLCNG